jgi:predicted phage terminase large subunit-like protein
VSATLVRVGGLVLDADKVLIDLDKAEAAESLVAFIRMAWSVVEPGQPYTHGWHIDAICEHLEAITGGHELEDGTPYNRLLINVPPGPGWVENLVMTDKGRVRLGDIKPGDMVLTHKGRFKNVSACYSKGMLDTIVVKTKSGREMVLTPDHNVLTPDGWVEARHLAVGSTLAVVTPENGLVNDAMSPEEARLLGYLIGDGSITQATVSFTNYDADTIEDFERCAVIVGFTTKRADRGVVRLLGGSKVHDWLKNHGLFRASSYEKHIPTAILNSSNKIIQNFIGAYWSCDGMFDVRPIKARGSSYRASATTVSKRLADDLLHALTRIGIRSVLRPKFRKLETAAQPGGIYRSYNIEVYAEEDTARFIDMPGLSARKNALACMCSKRRFDSVLMEDLVVEIVSGGNRECMCISVDEDHSLTWSDIAVHNTMKSLITNVFWPAWEWGPCNMPHLRYVCAAHKVENLSARDSRRMRQLITSEWYQARWGDNVKLAKDQNEKLNFVNSAGGFRIATAITSLTGIRGDRLLLDDPHSVDSAASDTQRQTEVTTFLEAIPTRLNDPIRSSIVVIMQRLHEEDVSGIILDKQLGYDHLMLPMEFDPARSFPTKLGFIDPRTEAGELLFPERFPAEVVARDKKVMGPYATAGQFQQEPTPRGGGVIKREWWRLYEASVFPPMEYVVAALDTAYTIKAENDFSALTVWGLFSGAQAQRIDAYATRGGQRRDTQDAMNMFDQAAQVLHKGPEGPRGDQPRLMLMDGWQDRLELHDLVEKVAKTCRRLKVDLLLIENKAAGHSVAQEIRRLYNHEDWGVQMYDPKTLDKLARLYSIQHLFAEGIVYAPDRAFADMVIQQVSVFPKGKNDDIVDTVSMAVKHFRDRGLLIREPEWQAEMQESMRHQSPVTSSIYEV